MQKLNSQNADSRQPETRQPAPPATTVHNLKQESMQPGDVYIGRIRRNVPESRWGNPYRIRAGQSRSDVIRRYRELLESRLESGKLVESDFKELQGKRLFCFCQPLACHGDVLAEYADRYGA